MPILVVDDYKTVARIIRTLLIQAGFQEIDEANDGEEALARMRERKYGLVLSDWYMAPTSGYELLQKAKADEQLRATPFIMISAEASPENLSAARKAGASLLCVPASASFPDRRPRPWRPGHRSRRRNTRTRPTLRPHAR